MYRAQAIMDDVVDFCSEESQIQLFEDDYSRFLKGLEKKLNPGIIDICSY